MPGTSVNVSALFRALGVIDTSLVTVSQDADGVEILNFPIKALREQILRCINCFTDGEFLSEAEIRKSVAEWDGRPLTIDHPRINDELVFADNDLNRQRFAAGSISKPRFTGGFLVVDAHLNTMKASTSVEGRGIVNALKTGNSDVEVSTGYAAHLSFERGKFDGELFNFAQFDIDPDHLALLPIGMAGACSVEDGCGAARAAQQRVAAAAKQEDHMKPNAIVELVKSALRAAGMSLEGDGGEVITDPPAGDPAAPASNAGGDGGDPPSPAGVTDPPAPAGDPPTPGSGGGPDPLEEPKTMDRANMILALVAAASVPFDKTELEAFDDEKLKSLAELADIDCGCGTGDPAPASNSGDPAPAGDPAPVAPVASNDPNIIALQAQVSANATQMSELVTQMTAIAELAANAKATADAEHAELVTTLNANAQCAITEGDLKVMTLSALRGLSKSIEVVDYSGLGRLRPLGNSEDDDGGYMDHPSLVADDTAA